MLHEISIKIVDFLLKHGTAPKNRSIYIYGTECFLSECIGNVLLFAVALPLHQGTSMLIWLLSFLSIRTHLGGYHAPTHWLCLIISTLVGIGSLFFNWIWTKLGMYSILVLILCDGYIIFTKAIMHPNHPISTSKSKRERCILLINTAVESIIIFIFIYLQNNWYAPIISGIFCAVLMSLMAKISFLSKNLPYWIPDTN